MIIMSINKDGRYKVVVTDGRKQTCCYFMDDYQAAVSEALEQTHCWPFHDILVYGMGSLMFAYRGGVKHAA